MSNISATIRNSTVALEDGHTNTLGKRVVIFGSFPVCPVIRADSGYILVMRHMTSQSLVMLCMTGSCAARLVMPWSCRQ